MYTYLEYVSPTYRRVKIIRVLIINKNICMSLASIKVNEILIWSWNNPLIGYDRIMHWSIDMGQSNVSVELSLLSRHLIMPHSEHLDKAFNIFAYLRFHLNSKLVINK